MNPAQIHELIQRKKLERTIKGLAVRVGDHDRYFATQASKDKFTRYHEIKGNVVERIEVQS